MTESRSSSTRKPSYAKRPSSDSRGGASSDRKSWKPRGEGSQQRPAWSGPRSGGDSKPRSFGDRGPSTPRPANRDDRPTKPRWSDRGDRNSAGPRPFNREDRPAAPRSSDRGDRNTSSARPFNRSDRPATARSFDRDDRRPSSPRPFNRDSRPAHPYDRDVRPAAPREERGKDWYSENRKSKFEKNDRDASDEFQDKPVRKIPEGADRADEIKACGINACRAIFTTRKADLVRAYVTEETVTEFGDMLKFCAANKKAYHVVTSEDLNKISGSTHHEGVCVIAKARPMSWQSLQTKLGEQKTVPSLLLILEDVGNPHNVGAMVRSAAHFGISAVLAPGVETFKPSPSLLRTAEGGAEQVDIVAAPTLEALVVELRKLGFKILATASNGKEKLYAETAIPARTALIIGNESRGISPAARKLADSTLSIPGSGTIESLNVSAATAVLCSEFWRRHKA